MSKEINIDETSYNFTFKFQVDGKEYELSIQSTYQDDDNIQLHKYNTETDTYELLFKSSSELTYDYDIFRDEIRPLLTYSNTFYQKFIKRYLLLTNYKKEENI